MGKTAKLPARKLAENENHLSLATGAKIRVLATPALHSLTKLNHAKIEKPPAFEGRAGGI